MTKASTRLVLAFISMGIGRHVPAPGTAGSLLALCLAWCIPDRHFYPALFFLLFCLIPLSIIAIRHHLVRNPDLKDPGYIVIDECIGMWIALLISPLGFTWQTIAFVLFRFFDIQKPGIIGHVDGLSSHDPLRHSILIIADDILAGILAGGLTTLINILYIYWTL